MPNETATSNNNYTTSELMALPTRVLNLINDFTAGIELSAARAGAGLTPASELEKEFYSILAAARTEQPERASAIEQRMAQPLRGYRSSRRFEAFSSIEASQPGAIESVDLAERHRTTVAPFAHSWVHIPAIVDGLVLRSSLEDHLLPQASFTGLKFHLSKVKCFDDTSGWGSDEIYIGANLIDETGDVSHCWFNVSQDFDEGEVKNYGVPGKEMQYFSLKEGAGKFPKIYTAVVSMVEKDWLKVTPWFQKLHDKIKEAVKELLKKLGFALGELIGLGDVGALVGTIVAKIVHFLMDWFIDIIGNDYMGSFTSYATINSFTGNWVTNDPFASWSKKFVAHGGHYHVWYGWHLVK